MFTIKNKTLMLVTALAAISTMSLSLTVGAQATIDQITQAGEQRIDAGAEAQKNIEKVANQTDSLVTQFKTVSKVVDGLKIYNGLLQRQIDNQEKEKRELRDSMDNVSLIQRQILPMMTRMLDALQDFITLDTPFLLKERNDRVARLREMLDRSDVTPAEKFRRVIEAFQIENDYGRTIESYKGTVNIDGKEQEVDFLRIGRVSLSYQSIGGNYTGAWDPESRKFVQLPPETYKSQIALGIRVAKKQIAPDLLVVPVEAPKGETL